MQHIEGCVFPYPVGNFSVNRAISDLIELGFTGAVIIGPKQQVTIPEKFRLYFANYITRPGIREIQKEIQETTKSGRLCMVKAGESTMNRSILTTPGVHILSGIHLSPKNAFDRVCAHDAADRGIALDIRLRPLWDQRGTARQRTIRLYEEIFLLHKRYGFPLMISSGAETIGDFRSVRSIETLLKEIGMDGNMIQSSWETIPNLIKGTNPVRMVF